MYDKKNKKWLSKPPNYPCIEKQTKDGKKIKMNLFKFREMKTNNEFGFIHSITNFLEHFHY